MSSRLPIPETCVTSTEPDLVPWRLLATPLRLGRLVLDEFVLCNEAATRWSAKVVIVKQKNPRFTGGFYCWGTWTRTKNK